ncbi:hypothetical protein [Motilibacter aurantiacus]|uniref:hypothetical protein n=1 Tax=Motilibacter aurantiacus TaxID=2714955 RepID=UPI0014095FB1|nr:hypothetical protein [Motilibacter aurantiacus]NHC47152.1 hypothetical protein [Motilibacter aurantiacus]
MTSFRRTRASRRFPSLWLGLAPLMVVVGCSSGGDSVAGGSTSATPRPGQLALSTLSSKLSCENVNVDTDQVFSRESGTCTSGADELGLYTFVDRMNRDRWIEAVHGLDIGTLVVGDAWVIAVDGDEIARRVQQLVGSEIR